MEPTSTRWRLRLAPRTALAAALVAGALLATPMAAQENPDFLFRTPKVTFSMYGGLAVAGANSDIFQFVTDTLTLEGSDFTGGLFGGELAFRAHERVDIAVNAGFSRSESGSEYRNWVDNLDEPIEQTTTFTRIPLTLGVKVYLKERGRSIGRFAWIPERWAPYVGGGGGMTYYEFVQEGDFIDYLTDPKEIFTDRFVSEGSAPTAFLRAGADLSLGPKFLFNADVRYTWADATMGRDFEDFDDIDLGGIDATLGFGIRF